MKRTCVFLVIATFLAPVAPAWAQADVLQLIPDDAIGFALVNRVGQTNDKIAAVAKRMNLPLPGSPLDLAKAALGVDKGLAEKGNLAIAAFAGKGEDDEPRPVIYVPVTDYKTFIDQLDPGETKDGITALTLKDGKSMVAGKRGSFALLAGVRDRDLLVHALKADKNVATTAESLTAWLGENDAAGVLTRHGLKLLAVQVNKGLGEAKQNLNNLPPEAQFVGKLFEGVESFVKSVETDVTHAGIALRVDAAGNLHISKRLQFQKGSGFAKAGAMVKAPPGGPVAGLPAGPFVVALGGTLPQDGMKAMMNLNMEIMKAGGQNIPAETLKKLEDVYGKMIGGMTGMAFVVQVGKENTPLFANMAGVMHTPDAPAYLAEYEKSVAVMNELTGGLNLPFLPKYELKKVKLAGKPALEMSADFAAAGVPEEMQKMFKTMFGPDGKMTISMAAKDDKTLLMRYTGVEGLKELMNAKELAGDADVALVTKSLPAGTQWAFYISPKGTTEFADRMIKAFSPIPLQIPQFPATPPVAVGAQISGQSFELHVVVPAGVVDSVSGYVEQLKRLFGGGA